MENKITQLELLAPAKNVEIGISAVNHGADAVYIGGPAFGARKAASNTIQDIEKLVKYAHLFNVKVYATVNTLLFDGEIQQAVDLIWQYYNIGVDGVIIQDMGLLECKLPPIPLHASTQTNNRSVEKVQFLESVGFSQVVLARELNLKQIAAINRATRIPLEFFIHGALCVSYSGQCYLSQIMTGRSANRGNCAQFCRHSFSLTDKNGTVIERDKHLLSLQDLNLSNYLEQLIQAGISSFKIEGRLKNEEYVKNVTAFYRQQLDQIIAQNPGLQRSSSGSCSFDFQPDLERTFLRGSTTYFLHHSKNKVAQIHSPKALGKPLGKVQFSSRDYFTINTTETLHNGDGLCFFNSQGSLVGIRVNRVKDHKIECHDHRHPATGVLIYRNNDINFLKQVKKSANCRKISVSFMLSQHHDRLFIKAVDEDGYSAEYTTDERFSELAQKPEKQLAAIDNQLQKTGSSIFKISHIQVNLNEQIPFIPRAVINNLRRQILDLLVDTRNKQYLPPRSPHSPNNTPWFKTKTDYTDNITNEYARAFYQRHGASHFASSIDLDPTIKQINAMTTRYCIKYQLDRCPHTKGHSKATWEEPLFLQDNNGKYRLDFDCKRCEMTIHVDKK